MADGTVQDAHVSRSEYDELCRQYATLLKAMSNLELRLDTIERYAALTDAVIKCGGDPLFTDEIGELPGAANEKDLDVIKDKVRDYIEHKPKFKLKAKTAPAAKPAKSALFSPVNGQTRWH